MPRTRGSRPVTDSPVPQTNSPVPAQENIKSAAGQLPPIQCTDRPGTPTAHRSASPFPDTAFCRRPCAGTYRRFKKAAGTANRMPHPTAYAPSFRSQSAERCGGLLPGTGLPARTVRQPEQVPLRQNSTTGATSLPETASKYGYCSKPNIPARMLVGKRRTFVL